MSGLSIRLYYILTGLYYAVLLVSFFAVTTLSFHTWEKITESETNHRLLCQAVDRLRQSSDDLTSFARLYVVTGKDLYKKNYTRVLSIRDGQEPRPERYHHLYWDLREEERSKNHPPGIKQSIESILKTLPFEPEERRLFQSSKDRSDGLAEIELTAFNAMVGLFKDSDGRFSVYGDPDQTKAVRLLFSEDYLNAKHEIMAPLDELMRKLEERFSEKKDELHNQGMALLILDGLIAFSLISSFVLQYRYTRKGILEPLHDLSRLIEGLKKNQPVDLNKTYNPNEAGLILQQFTEIQETVIQERKERKDREAVIQNTLKVYDDHFLSLALDLEYRVTSVSISLSRLLGVSESELQGKVFPEFFHGSSKPSVLNEIHESLASDKTWRGSLVFQLKNDQKALTGIPAEAFLVPHVDETHGVMGYMVLYKNISDQIEVQQLQLKNKKLYHELIKAGDMVDQNINTSSTDLSGTIVSASLAFSRTCGYTKDELIGQKHSIVRHPEAPDSIYEDLWATISNNRIWRGEFMNRRKDGTPYWVYATVTPVFDEHEQKIGYIAIRTDITDQKKVEELQVTDPLTGLYHRRHFHEVFSRICKQSERDNQFFAFAILDLDYFKEYNDHFGYGKGDQALIDVANLIHEKMKWKSENCFRLEGKQFGLILHNLSEEEIQWLVDEIRKSIEGLKIEHPTRPDQLEYLTATVGLVKSSGNASVETDDMVRMAEIFLARAKRQGRNRLEAGFESDPV